MIAGPHGQKQQLCFLLSEGEPGVAVKLLPCHHEVVAKSRKHLAEMQGKTVYIRPKVVGSFLGPCASRSYVHRIALLLFI
jgi:hypothetical protein